MSGKVDRTPSGGLGELARIIEWRHDKVRRTAAVVIETAKAVLLASRGMVPKRRWVRAVHSKNRRIRRKGLKRARASFAAADRMLAASLLGQARIVTIRCERPPWQPLEGRNYRRVGDHIGAVSIGQRVRVIDEPGVHPVHGAYDSRTYFEVGTVTVGKAEPRPLRAWWTNGELQEILQPVRDAYEKAEDHLCTVAPEFTKHTRDDANPDYLAATLGDPLPYDSLQRPDGPPELGRVGPRGFTDDLTASMLDEATREPMPVVELSEVPE